MRRLDREALVRQLDPQRLVTASHAGDLSRDDVRQYLREVKLDFIAPHRPRNADSASMTQMKTEEYLKWMREMSRIKPVHYQEPFRRGYRPQAWEPVVADLITDWRGAVVGGAAGWCFHNGGQKTNPDGRPRRSFDLSQQRLFDQFDTEETAVLGRLRDAAAPTR